MPGGESYTANLFRDAGADYLFADLPGTDSHPLSFETVFEKAYQADIWLFKYNQSKDMTYADLQQEYAPYAHFEAFQKKRIYAVARFYPDISSGITFRSPVALLSFDGR